MIDRNKPVRDDDPTLDDDLGMEPAQEVTANPDGNVPGTGELDSTVDLSIDAILPALLPKRNLERTVWINRQALRVKAEGDEAAFEDAVRSTAEARFGPGKLKHLADQRYGWGR